MSVMRTCKKCNTEKLESLFVRRGNVRGYGNVCKECANKTRKKIKRVYPVLTEYCCNVCKVTKPIQEFNKNKRNPLGIVKECKDCRAVKSKKYYNKNKDVIKEKTNEYYKQNKSIVKEKRKQYSRRRLQTDIKYKIARNLRNRLYYALQFKEWKKNTHFSEYIGCDLNDLKKHLESQFKPGMSWDNYGKWHIDHIVPLSKAEDEQTMYKLCHYTNLRPEWGDSNVKKYNEIIYTVKQIDASVTHPFLLNIHYAKRIPSISYAFGLFANDSLVGVVTYGKTSSPLTAAALVGVQHSSKVYELNRLCLLHNLKNEASILVGRSLKLLPKNTVVLSFADSEQNHLGIVYQATNFKYYGLTETRNEIALKSNPNRHALSVYDESKGQENRIQYLKDKYGDDLYWKKRSQKHRYVYIVGDKSLYSLIKYKECHYPKNVT